MLTFTEAQVLAWHDHRVPVHRHQRAPAGDRRGVQSFHAFPVGPEPFVFLRSVRPETWGTEIFAIGFAIALPMIAMLLFVNIVLGVISRVAQQLNIFAIGFPVTLGAPACRACC
jgi:Bacterial export proteins, family 1